MLPLIDPGEHLPPDGMHDHAGHAVPEVARLYLEVERNPRQVLQQQVLGLFVERLSLCRRRGPGPE